MLKRFKTHPWGHQVSVTHAGLWRIDRRKHRTNIVDCNSWLIHGCHWYLCKYPDQDSDDELIPTLSSTSPPTGVSLEDPDATVDNSTQRVPLIDFDQSTGSGMLPLPEEADPTPSVEDPEAAQPTAKNDPQSEPPVPKGSDVIPECE